MNRPPATGSRVQRLREDFDRAFAELPVPPDAGRERLLAVAVAGHAYALRLSELAGLSAGRPLHPGGGHAPGFLGLAGLWGSLLPVWDLAQLLGHPQQGAQAHWLALAAGEQAWALAFDRFDGSFGAARQALLPCAEGAAAGFADQACETEGVLRPVLRMERLLEELKGRIKA